MRKSLTLIQKKARGCLEGQKSKNEPKKCMVNCALGQSRVLEVHSRVANPAVVHAQSCITCAWGAQSCACLIFTI